MASHRNAAFPQGDCYLLPIALLLGKQGAYKNMWRRVEMRHPTKLYSQNSLILWTYGESNPNLVHAMDAFYH